MTTRIIERVTEASEFAGCSLVPTMGALHRGHEELIRAAGAAGEKVVVSIFVNRRQFGPGEDFDTYPRDLEKDLAVCESLGVAAVFAPGAEEVYPPGFVPVAWPSDDRVRRELFDVMCGRFRPGHFEGVVTVVARLFDIVRPASAWFGWKDAQQFIIIRRMAQGLGLPIRLHAIETVREPDGLALSSRNAYLDSKERRRAVGLSWALRTAIAGSSDAGGAVATAREAMITCALEVEYVELRTLDGLLEVPVSTPLDSLKGSALLAAAVRLGRTRLIDNVRI